MPKCWKPFIDRSLTPFSTIYSHITVASSSTHVFPRVFTHVLISLWPVHLPMYFLECSHMYSFHCGQFIYQWVSWSFHTCTQYNSPFKQLAAFPHILLAHWWKTMTLVALVFVKRRNECWPIWCSISKLTTYKHWIDWPRRYQNTGARHVGIPCCLFLCNLGQVASKVHLLTKNL